MTSAAQRDTSVALHSESAFLNIKLCAESRAEPRAELLYIKLVFGLIFEGPINDFVQAFVYHHASCLQDRLDALHNNHGIEPLLHITVDDPHFNANIYHVKSQINYRSPIGWSIDLQEI